MWMTPSPTCTAKTDVHRSDIARSIRQLQGQFDLED